MHEIHCCREKNIDISQLTFYSFSCMILFLFLFIYFFLRHDYEKFDSQVLSLGFDEAWGCEIATSFSA